MEIVQRNSVAAPVRAHLGLVLLLGLVASRPRWPWLLPVRNAISTARILPALAGAVLLGSARVSVRKSRPRAGLRRNSAAGGAWHMRRTLGV